MQTCDDCSNCNLYARNESVPYIVHESDMARMEHTNKRQFITILVLVFCLVFSWLGFLIYESQYETVTETTVQDVWQSSDANSTNRFVGGDNYGSDTESADGSH